MKKADIKVIKANISQHEFIFIVPLSDSHWDEPQYADWIRGYKSIYTIHRRTTESCITSSIETDIAESRKIQDVICYLEIPT